MEAITEALIAECRREEESCLYTSTAMHERLGWLQVLKNCLIVLPILLSSVAGWYVLADYKNELVKWVIAGCSLLSGTLPAIYAALKYDDQLAHLQVLAGEFKNLQHEFRHTANVVSLKPAEPFEAEVRSLRERLAKARASAYPIPERFFVRAQQKVRQGNFAFDVDQQQKSLE